MRRTCSCVRFDEGQVTGENSTWADHPGPLEFRAACTALLPVSRNTALFLLLGECVSSSSLASQRGSEVNCRLAAGSLQQQHARIAHFSLLGSAFGRAMSCRR